jgi:hypothetical protein
MKFDWRNNRDVLGGLFYIGIGAVAIWMARDYPFGSALRMGPGYFPTVLSGIMILFGITIMATGIKKPEKLKGSNWSIRALIVLPIATAVFGWMMEEAGFIPAMLLLIPMSAASGKEFEWKEIAMLTVGLTVMCSIIFIWGLGLPYPMIKGLWGY